MCGRKKKAAAAQPNPFTVGDILHYSWGYEQTNCEFWQVVGVKGKTVEIREIAQKSTRPNCSMSEYVTAVKDQFINEKIETKVVQWSTWNDAPTPYLAAPHGSFIPWNGRDCYSSWYA